MKKFFDANPWWIVISLYTPLYVLVILLNCNNAFHKSLARNFIEGLISAGIPLITSLLSLCHKNVIHRFAGLMLCASSMMLALIFNLDTITELYDLPAVNAYHTYGPIGTTLITTVSTVLFISLYTLLTFIEERKIPSWWIGIVVSTYALLPYYVWGNSPVIEKRFALKLEPYISSTRPSIILVGIMIVYVICVSLMLYSTLRTRSQLSITTSEQPL